MSTVPRPRTPSMTESRNTDGRIRGGPDDGSLPRVDRGAEEGLDPTVPARAPEQGGEVRVPDPARAARPVERELRGHIVESSAANGGNVHASLEALGLPRDVGRHYREIYGYGTAFKLMFAAIAFLLAIPSVPVLVIGSETVFPFTLSIVFVVAAAAWILWVGVAAGTQAGIVAGLAGMVGRISAFGAVAFRESGAITSAGGLGLLVAVSV